MSYYSGSIGDIVVYEDKLYIIIGRYDYGNGLRLIPYNTESVVHTKDTVYKVEGYGQDDE